MQYVLTPAWISPEFARYTRRAWHSRHNPRMDRAVEPLISALEAEDALLRGLVSRMQAGDADAQTALSQLYDVSISRVFSLVRRFVGSDAATEDVTQEIYLQAWTQAQRFDAERGAVMAWLLNLARSRALDAWRKASSSAVIHDGALADDAAAQMHSPYQPEDFLEATSTRSSLHAALARLPAQTRQMLSLAFFHDMTHQDISAHLNLPLGTVKSTVRRALLNLREHLATLGIGPEQLASLSLDESV